MQSTLHLDLSLSSVDHTPLSPAVECHDLDLSDPVDALVSRTVPVVATSSGRVDAVAFWFAVRWTQDGEATSTRREDSHVRQAAFVVRPSVAVVQGQTVGVVVRYMRGVLAMCLE